MHEQLQSSSKSPEKPYSATTLEEYRQKVASGVALFNSENRRAEERRRAQEVKTKLQYETDRLREWNRKRVNSSNELSRVFGDLQALSADNHLGLRSPELVVVGMQSDGKSTFVEALLGFNFNVVSSNIGTRRPLVISMINSRAHTAPSCRFRSEDCGEGAEFEAGEVPVEMLSREIMRRTNEVAGSDKTRVSSKPIFLRVEYANCANLTIYDTPGFRLHGDQQLSDDIHEMVMDIIRPPHRIIVCLEQSTVEWSNTTSRQIVEKVDPTFSRTILIQTKFDNRIKVVCFLFLCLC